MWKNLIRGLPANDVQLNEDGFGELAKMSMNSREIKKFIKIALVWAPQDKPLKMNHFKAVSGIRTEVD